MDIKLLRAKMALKGDFTWTALAELLELSRPALMSRLEGAVSWRLFEMRKIIEKYDITEDEACQIFGLGNNHEN